MDQIIVPWENQSDIWWNETCARIMEHFGLPGDRYTTEINPDCMFFNFKDSKDALLCRLLISEAVS